jgi:HlyD family secretion protein
MPVKKGDLVAVLEVEDLKQDVALRAAELKAAESQLDLLKEGSREEDKEAAKFAMQKAEFNLEDMKAGPRPQEIAAAAAAVKVADADRERALADYRRAISLMENKQVQSITQEQFDLAKFTYHASEARLLDAQKKLELMKDGYRQNQIKAAQAAFEQAKWQSTLVEKGPRPQEIETAKAKVEQAKAALELAATRIKYATLYSPLDGVVLSKNAEEGEYVAPGTPVVTIADTVHVWLRAYVPESELFRVKADRKVRVRIDANDKSKAKFYEGRVSFISEQAEFTPKNVQTEKERVKLVFRIKIDITNPNGELKIGMPADAVIDEGK